jgi:hypothetical protein
MYYILNYSERKNMKKLISLLVVLMGLSACNSGTPSNNTQHDQTTGSQLYMFGTQTAVNGSFGASVNNGGQNLFSDSAASAFCNADANNPVKSTQPNAKWKILVYGNNAVIPNTEYKLVDGHGIKRGSAISKTTDFYEYGYMIPASNQNFIDFMRDAYSGFTWFGDNTGSHGGNCGNWSNPLANSGGIIVNGPNQQNYWGAITSNPCSGQFNTANLICVQQKSTAAAINNEVFHIIVESGNNASVIIGGKTSSLNSGPYNTLVVPISPNVSVPITLELNGEQSIVLNPNFDNGTIGVLPSKETVAMNSLITGYSDKGSYNVYITIATPKMVITPLNIQFFMANHETITYDGTLISGNTGGSNGVKFENKVGPYDIVYTNTITNITKNYKLYINPEGFSYSVPYMPGLTFNKNGNVENINFPGLPASN